MADQTGDKAPQIEWVADGENPGPDAPRTGRVGGVDRFRVTAVPGAGALKDGGRATSWHAVDLAYPDDPAGSFTGYYRECVLWCWQRLPGAWTASPVGKGE